MEKTTKDKIRKGLLQHRGAIAEVVRRTDRIKDGGYSRSQVDYVLRGVYENEEILTIASEVLAERMSTRAATQARIQTLLIHLEEATA